MRPPLEKTKPAGTGGLRCNVIDRNWGPISCQDTAETRDLQAFRIRKRFAVSWPVATVIAEHAFSAGGAQ